LHSLGDDERELLRYAAMLHHIGSFLTHTGYEKHTNYLVKNAELLGFDEIEIALLAQICLYHRGGLPRARDAEYTALTSSNQEKVRTLSLLLRLAENLDRSRSSIVNSATFSAAKGGKVQLHVEAEFECPVELSGLKNQTDIFARSTGRALELTYNLEDLG
jgi:exopolyphosphatase / guanosine-5'-triphosphate,3'-diphosphate pyrophosphatase